MAPKSSKLKKKSEKPTDACATVTVECPPELTGEARQEWDRIVPLLAAAGRLEATDRAALAVYCVAYAAWLSAAITVQTYGPIMKSPNGHPIQSPAVSILNQNADIILRIATQFGFTPAGRLRLPSSKDVPSWDDGIPRLEDIAVGLKPLQLE
jgi:P27 family predicted phage terminase small subunit